MGILKKEPVLLNKDSTNEDGTQNLDVVVSESKSESESKDEDVKLTEPSKKSIYNRDGLLDKLGDVSWPKNLEWIHKLSLDINQEQEVGVNDDLARELAFYTQALEGVRQAFSKFQSKRLPFLWASDYYAEMVKTNAWRKSRGGSWRRKERVRRLKRGGRLRRTRK